MGYFMDKLKERWAKKGIDGYAEASENFTIYTFMPAWNKCKGYFSQEDVEEILAEKEITKHWKKA